MQWLMDVAKAKAYGKSSCRLSMLIPKGHGCEHFVPGALGKGLTEIEVQVASQEAAGEEAHL